MKKIVLFILLTAFISGCAGVGYGSLYTDITEPVNATSNDKGSKTGESECINILGLVAYGDCSIEAAAKKGKIAKIKSVDKKTFSILGIFAKHTMIVTGE